MASINQLVVVSLASWLVTVASAWDPPTESKWLKKQAASKLKLSGAYCQDIGQGCYKCKDPNRPGLSYERCYGNQELQRTRRQLDGYRFDDEHFSQPTELAGSASGDGCKSVRRDSMLCMVCKDPKTNAKYEQCSYVSGLPLSSHEGKSHHHHHHNHGKPKSAKQRKPKPKQPESSEEQEEPEDDREGHGSHQKSQTYHYPGYSSYSGDGGGSGGEGSGSGEEYGASAYSGSGSGEEDASSPSEQVKSGSGEKGCKKVQKDGETCTVCTDPSTGAKSERCNYAFEPKDKAYAYTKSKSFGYPDSSPKSYSSSGGDDEQSSGEDYSSSAPEGDYIRSESERISKKVRGEGDCREEKRDDMICKICKNANGDDLEQCNYSYEPADRHYAYTKSKHTGSESPDEEDAKSYSTSAEDYIPKPQESQVHSSSASPDPLLKLPSGVAPSSRVDSGFHSATQRRAEIEKIVQDMKSHDRSNCTKSLRGGMTCFSCRDARGFSNEECVFVTDPESSQHQPAASSSVRIRRDDGQTETQTTTATGAEEEEEADYQAETRPMYDKVLGLTLPAYMVKRSAQEVEFDQAFRHDHH